MEPVDVSTVPPMEGSMRRGAIWRSLEIFRTMTDEALDDLERSLEPVTFEPEQVILRQGEEGDDMYLLNEGRVRVEIQRKDAALLVFHLEAPGVFGEMALITHAPRSATVIAASHLRCERVTRPQFNRLVAANPIVAVFLTEAVGRRLLEADTIQVVGKYRVTGRLGEGGVATVFEAIQPELGQPVALKMLSHSLVLHPGFVEQFRREAQIVAGLSHEHVVRVLDTEHAYGTHFIVMECLKGTLLEEVIEKKIPLSWATIRRILMEVCEALEFAHGKHLLHRDIKPANIFLTTDNRAKILDFGLATTTGGADDHPQQRMGTPYYMAPEQILGRPLDARTDVYALGVTAFELCTGQVPYDAASLKELLRCHLKDPLPDPCSLRPEIPSDLVDFIKISCCKHPDGRFPSCEAAATHLRVGVELPFVESMELTTLAISYHPYHRERVRTLVDQLVGQLDPLMGVQVARGDRTGHPHIEKL